MRLARVAGLPVIARRPRCSRTETLGRDVRLCNWMSSSSRPCTRGCVIRVREAWVAERLRNLRNAGVSGGVLSAPFLLSGDAGPLAGVVPAWRAAAAGCVPRCGCRAAGSGPRGRCRRHGERCLHRGKRGIFMRSVIVGAGPTGLYTAIALARRGHQVTVIDRDPGPDGAAVGPQGRDAVPPSALFPAAGRRGAAG